ncbi:hypothetical protein [Tumebacillus flagellatus]|uniref:Uncharacterized protein n=1 Tax=Tumebacillus flagellatus TaxID=1157490 RepID=A0A074LPR0_9BACL|nr:hypothetical protein [Tumebacillus flagellatus]KEO82485.1 hypothetical protein EL26_15520 [Tumebacillus flagellatus]
MAKSQKQKRKQNPSNPRILPAGLGSGLFLGLALTLASRVSGYPLDTVLLDLSYVPVLSNFNTLFVQWAAHLLVALVAAWVYAKLTARLDVRSRRLGLVYGVLVSSIYFVLAPQAAPELMTPFSWEAYLLWVAFHMLYGIVLEKLL